MNATLKAFLDDQAQQLDDEVQQALQICGGDAIAALRTTLIANAFLEAEIERLKAEVSTGFRRGKIRKPATKESVMHSPEPTPQQKAALSGMANVYGQHIMQAYNNERDNPTLRQLPDDMQIESFMVGVLTGLMSAMFQIVAQEQHQAVFDNVIAYVPAAAEQALRSLEPGGLTKPQ
jgi:hypothetical protein